ncbi:ribonuclease H-like domain-containing protein [Tanacetum coccineum]
MTGNISYLSEYEPFNEGCVSLSFGHGRGKITGKGSIKTSKLKFENVYFVEELKFNLFSVSQICDNKNSILFTATECLVLGKDFKLVDDKHVLLRTPRQQNMYTIDLKNIVPHKNLTCLIAKALVDECMLWHRRCDNRGEFRNREMDEFYSRKGIKREFSNARTPQQNGVAERRNWTLIEAARTMLADAKLPVTFWAEAINTACYVQNRFDAIGDEGYIVGYSLNSKAFRVFNKSTKKVEENLHVDFLENRSIEKGTGPDWLFDINTLTNSMNYVPVVVA